MAPTFARASSARSAPTSSSSRPAQERVFRAAARAQRQTGVAISTHCQRTGRLGMDQVKILLDEGVPPDRIVIGHHGDKRHVDFELELLEQGVYVQFDHVGFKDLQPDEQRARNAKAVIDAGYVERLLISQDMCLPHQLRWYGGYGYGHLLTTFVPMLRAAGVTPGADRHAACRKPGAGALDPAERVMAR